ncbi:MAG: LytTR family DNA-binding domain-containing protein [Polyangiales bacterium]|jgi:DNA-binding LytR/AlgR family response regulator
MRVLIVDDEPIARQRLAHLLQDIDDVEVIGEATDGSDALRRIKALSPDVVLLDITMPVIDGLHVAKMHPDTCVIFTTAHERHAVEAFSLAATDYLLKPIEPHRLRTALERASKRLASRDIDREVSTHVLTAHHGRTTRYVDPRTIRRDYHLRESLNELETQLEPLGFVRCHRSELINVRAIKFLRTDQGSATAVLTDGTEVPISRRRIALVRRAIAKC